MTHKTTERKHGTIATARGPKPTPNAILGINETNATAKRGRNQCLTESIR